MRPPFTLEDLAKLARLPTEEVSRYRELGLLDPEADGVLDDYDVLRLRLILHYGDLGYTPEDLKRAIDDGEDIVYSDLLYAPVTERITVEEAASELDLPVERIEALRTAVGIAGMPIDHRDIEVLATLKRMLELGLPFEALLEAARVYGDALRRLAETETRLLRFYVAEQLEEAGDLDEAERARRAQELLELIQATVDPIVTHVHRLHMLRSAVEDAFALLGASGGHSRGAMEATICFVDLASFTPLAQVHGDEVAADVLERFDTLVREFVPRHDGSLVKQIGDAFMLRFPDAVSAIRFATELDEATARERHFPAVRIGIHSGPVLYRVGDYVGNTVNLASRIATLATANEILVTKPVAQEAVEADIDVEPVGEREVRGLEEPVALYRVVRTGARATRRERDPVCGMLVGSDAAARLIHGGFEFAFCSEGCLKRFLEQPTRYIHAGRDETG